MHDDDDLEFFHATLDEDKIKRAILRYFKAIEGDVSFEVMNGEIFTYVKISFVPDGCNDDELEELASNMQADRVKKILLRYFKAVKGDVRLEVDEGEVYAYVDVYIRPS